MVAKDAKMANYEENHFLRGDRKLSQADVEIAMRSGPILVLIAKRKRTKTFKEFVNIIKENFPNSAIVNQAIPVLSGRRFEAFRLYLRTYDLPDPSSWITDQNEMNSEEYETDFDPLFQRNASAIQDWSQYVPRKRSLLGVPRYTNFFKSIKYFASKNNCFPFLTSRSSKFLAAGGPKVCTYTVTSSNVFRSISVSSFKNKIISRYLDENEELNQNKTADINVLLNRVKVSKKQESIKKILFSTITSVGVLGFCFFIF